MKLFPAFESHIVSLTSEKKIKKITPPNINVGLTVFILCLTVLSRKLLLQ